MDSSRDVLTRAAPPPRFTVAYGQEPEQIADVWLPSAPGASALGAAALVIFVHGGFWRAAYDRVHVRPLANALAARGHAVAAIEYRRVGQPQGGWPGTFDDVALACDTLPALLGSLTAETAAAQGASWSVAASAPVVASTPVAREPSRVIVAGHSAGGHLALWAVARAGIPETSPWRLPSPPVIDGVLALAPVCDLRDAYHRGLGAGAVSELVGGGPEEFGDRYAAVDPGALPFPKTPAVLVHGARDDLVPVEQSRHHAARAMAAADCRVPARVRLVELPDADHFAVIDPLSSAWPVVLKALEQLAEPGRMSFA